MWVQDFTNNEGNNTGKNKQEGYYVIRDNREKDNHGWYFETKDLCLGTNDDTVKTGDYTLLGYEDIFTIERKGCSSELANNLTESRWPKFLDRLSKIKHSFIICEFPLQEIINFPFESNLPQRVKDEIKIRGPFLIKLISEQMLRYNINIIWADNPYNAQVISKSLFKRIYEQYQR